MKIDRKLSKELAQKALVSSAIAGGSVATRMKVVEKKEGIVIHLKNASLNEENYHLELDNNKLVLYTLYGEGSPNPEGGLPYRATTVQVFPIAHIVDREEIDAVFEGGVLEIHLPFLPNREEENREIPIRSRYSNGFGF